MRSCAPTSVPLAPARPTARRGGGPREGRIVDGHQAQDPFDKCGPPGPRPGVRPASAPVQQLGGGDGRDADGLVTQGQQERFEAKSAALGGDQD